MCIYLRATFNNDVGATAAVPRQVRGRTRLSGSLLRAVLRQLHCALSRLLHAALNKRENSWTRVPLLRRLLETTFSLICFAVLGVSLSAIASRNGAILMASFCTAPSIAALVREA